MQSISNDFTYGSTAYTQGATIKNITAVEKIFAAKFVAVQPI